MVKDLKNLLRNTIENFLLKLSKNFDEKNLPPPPSYFWDNYSIPALLLW